MTQQKQKTARRPRTENEVAVYNGRECIGTIFHRSGQYVAHDAEGGRIGAFDSSKQAAAAIFQDSARASA